MQFGRTFLFDLQVIAYLSWKCAIKRFHELEKRADVSMKTSARFIQAGISVVSSFDDVQRRTMV